MNYGRFYSHGHNNNYRMNNLNQNKAERFHYYSLSKNNQGNINPLSKLNQHNKNDFYSYKNNDNANKNFYDKNANKIIKEVEENNRLKYKINDNNNFGKNNLYNNYITNKKNDIIIGNNYGINNYDKNNKNHLQYNNNNNAIEKLKKNKNINNDYRIDINSYNNKYHNRLKSHDLISKVPMNNKDNFMNLNKNILNNKNNYEFEIKKNQQFIRYDKLSNNKRKENDLFYDFASKNDIKINKNKNIRPQSQQNEYRNNKLLKEENNFKEYLNYNKDINKGKNNIGYEYGSKNNLNKNKMFNFEKDRQKFESSNNNYHEFYYKYKKPEENIYHIPKKSNKIFDLNQGFNLKKNDNKVSSKDELNKMKNEYINYDIGLNNNKGKNKAFNDNYKKNIGDSKKYLNNENNLNINLKPREPFKLKEKRENEFKDNIKNYKYNNYILDYQSNKRNNIQKTSNQNGSQLEKYNVNNNQDKINKKEEKKRAIFEKNEKKNDDSLKYYHESINKYDNYFSKKNNNQEKLPKKNEEKNKKISDIPKKYSFKSYEEYKKDNLSNDLNRKYKNNYINENLYKNKEEGKKPLYEFSKEKGIMDNNKINNNIDIPRKNKFYEEKNNKILNEKDKDIDKYIKYNNYRANSEDLINKKEFDDTNKELNKDKYIKNDSTKNYIEKYYESRKNLENKESVLNNNYINKNNNNELENKNNNINYYNHNQTNNNKRDFSPQISNINKNNNINNQSNNINPMKKNASYDYKNINNYPNLMNNNFNSNNSRFNINSIQNNYNKNIPQNNNYNINNMNYNFAKINNNQNINQFNNNIPSVNSFNNQNINQLNNNHITSSNNYQQIFNNISQQNNINNNCYQNNNSIQNANSNPAPIFNNNNSNNINFNNYQINDFQNNANNNKITNQNNNVVNNESSPNLPRNSLDIKKLCANGLQNIGATCYMNATLQCLAHIDKFIKYLFRKRKDIKNERYEKKLTNSFLEVLENIWENNSIKDYPPNNFKELISKMNPLFAGIQANDSKDLVLFLLETMHNELNKVKNANIMYEDDVDQYNFYNSLQSFTKYFQKNFQSIVSDLFYGMYDSIMKCLNCNIMTHNIQCYNILIIPLEEVRKFKNRAINQVTIRECFEYYQKPEYMTGENQIYCNKCKQMANSMNSSNLIIGPKVLVINLNRGKGLQFDIKLDFDEYIDINEFIYFKNSPCKYQLIGVVTHFGPSGMSGHFIAFCKSFVDNKWYKYNDSLVSPSSFPDAKNTGVPYILFYSAIE